MQTFTHESSIRLPQPLSRVFPFFADARSLERLTPPWLRFEILTPGPIRIAAGTRIDYRLRLHGVPIRWQSEITAWSPPTLFVDEQRRGPYRLWVHEHRFEERGGTTVAEDFVRYAVRGGRIVDRLFVRRDLDRIFRYRRERLRHLFGTADADGGIAAPPAGPGDLA